MSRLKLSISGKVQGVGFRFSAHEKAAELGLRLHGAENKPDGRVEIVLEGEAHVLQEFIDWATMGPSLARVDGVDVQWLH